MKKLLTMMVAAFFGCPLFATTWYVNGTSGSDSYSGKSSAAAKKTIQAAIDASLDGDIILVSAGTYAPIRTGNKRVEIIGEGAERTIIDGCHSGRCVTVGEVEGLSSRSYVATNTVVRGFTIQNGYLYDGNGIGALGGTFYNCVFKGNRTSENKGSGGGCERGVLYNCLVINNYGVNGGGAEGCLLRNCTLVGNQARDNGSSDMNCDKRNCIVYGNVGYTQSIVVNTSSWGTDMVDSYGYRSENCCSDNPQFIDAAHGDYHLAVGSPCIDAGDNSYVTSETDLDGNSRIVNEQVDIGCYEYGTETSLNNGLIAWYKFDGNANDLSGNGNNGVVHGATLATDRFGNANGAYSFDGDDWIEVANSVSLSNVRQRMSFSAWVNLAGNPIDEAWPMICKSTGSDGYSVFVCRDKIQLYWGGERNDIMANQMSGGFQTGKWYHVVCSVSEDSVVGYVDGVEVGRVAVAGENLVRDVGLLIGKDPPERTEYFTGAMDDLRIYNRALSAAEVKALYEREGGSSAGGVQLWENGPYWATCNVGASDAESEGWSFLFGDTRAYRRVGDTGDQWEETGSVVSAGATDPAEAYWGEGWRCPTGDEYRRLFTDCDFLWDVVNGVTGWRLQGRGSFRNNSIFIPLPPEDPMEDDWLRDYRTDSGDVAQILSEGAKCWSDDSRRIGPCLVHWWGFEGSPALLRAVRDTPLAHPSPEPAVHTVTFDAEGGTAGWTQGEVAEGAAVGALPTATRAGYEFLGWFTAAVGGTQVTAATVVTADVTFYAHWTQNVTYYTVTFNANGGSCSTSSKQYASGEALGTLPTATRSGYVFDGWYTSSSGGTQVTAEMVVTADVTLYAHWTQSSTGGYDWEYRVEGGFARIIGVTPKPAGTLTIPPSIGGYTVKWLRCGPCEPSLSEFGLDFSGVTSFNLPATLTFADVADFEDSRWYANQSGVAVSGEWAIGWKSSGSSLTIPSGVKKIAVDFARVGGNEARTLKSISLPDGLQIIASQAFDGQNKLRDVHIPASVTEIGLAAFCEVPGPFYFHGSKPKVSDCAGRSGADYDGGPVFDQGVIYFKRGASGWTDGGTWQGLRTYAWDDVQSYTVTFNANGGSCSTSSKQYASGETLGTLPTATRSGYTFDGWYTSSSGGTQVTAETVVTADVTFYAHWTKTSGGGGGDDPDEPIGYGDEFNGMVGVRFEEDLDYLLRGLGLEPRGTCTAKGLPAGIKIDAMTGLLAGVPTKAGTFFATLTDARKRTASVTFTIAPLPEWGIGTFTGMVNSEPGGMAVTMTVGKNGKISGKVVAGGKNWTFTDTAYDVESSEDSLVILTTAKSGKETRNIWLAVCPYGDAAENGRRGLLSAMVEGELEDIASMIMWRNVWKDKGAAQYAAILQGSYTASLAGLDSYGYLSLKVDAKGGVKVTGKLPDGTSASSSLSLVSGDGAGGEFFAVWTMAPSAYKGGCVSGQLYFGDDERGTVSGTCAWMSFAPTATGDYGAGFNDALTVNGAYYDTGANIGRYYSRLTFSAGTPELRVAVKVTDAEYDDYDRPHKYSYTEWSDIGSSVVPDGVGVEVGRDGKFFVPKATKPIKGYEPGEWFYEGENDVSLTLSFAKATGIFKGSFTCWYDYISACDYTKEENSETFAHASKKVSFEGIWVQGRSLCGFYLWDQTGIYWVEKPNGEEAEKTFKYKESFPVELQ